MIVRTRARLVVASGCCAAYGGFYVLTKHWQSDPHSTVGPRWLRVGLHNLLRSIVEACGVKSDVVVTDGRPLPPAPVVITIAPHGPYAVGHLCLSAGRFRGDRRFAGHEKAVYGGASVLFRIPLLREALLALGVREARAAVLDAALAGGASVVLSTGGVWEQTHTDCAREQLITTPRLGFARLALRHGVPIVPSYAFGENQLYGTVDAFPALRRWLARRWRVGICFCVGKWWCPILPRRTTHVVAVGRPIPTASVPCPDPTDAQVHAVVDAWTAEMLRLFDDHKHHLPPAVAARGLRIAVSDPRR